MAPFNWSSPKQSSSHVELLAVLGAKFDGNNTIAVESPV